MEPNLIATIRRAPSEAQAAGKDYLTQTEEAVKAVLQTFPDMTASEALVQAGKLSTDQSLRLGGRR